MKTILMKSSLLLLVMLAFLSCSDSNNQLIDRLKKAVESVDKNEAGYEVVELGQLTDFEWDTLYYFHQLDDKNYISQQIGFKWDGDAVPNLHRRFLFVKDGKVVSYTDYEFSELPLIVYGCVEDRWIYPRNRANFATFKYCQGEEFSYPFIPVPCVGDFKEMMGKECPEPAAE